MGNIIAGKIAGTTPLLFFTWNKKCMIDLFSQCKYVALRNNDNTTCTNHAQVRCTWYKTKTKQTKIFPLKEELN
jgi:hypothetical protein